MKKYFLLLFLASAYHTVAQTSGMTYMLNGGRLGDNLVNFCKSKWLAYKYKMPFFYTPFPYSDQLQLSIYEKTEREGPGYYRAIQLNHENDINPTAGVLYVSTYYMNPNDWQIGDGVIAIDFLLNDKVFLDELRRDFEPRYPLNLIPLPNNSITIALHLRKAAGPDAPLLHGLAERDPRQAYTDWVFPLKCPPDEFYMSALKTLSELFHDRPIYAYLFTDDPNPEKFAQKYALFLNKPNITFDWRKQGNTHAANVIEDFKSLQQFDCLIRADSNFSKISDVVGNNKIIMFPKRSHWEGNFLIIDEIQTTIKDHDWVEAMKELSR